MRSSSVFGRIENARNHIVAPQLSQITLPRTRQESINEIVAAELPLCQTRFETVSCLLLVVMIAATGTGIGVWYTLAS